MNSINKTKTNLHFAKKKYPTFGRGVYNDDKPPKTVTDSPYYYWFRFLQLNKDYIETELNNGIGKCSYLYKDFGPIAKIDFKTWFNSHAHLFAEESTKYSVKVAKSKDDLAPMHSKEAINVVVSLDWHPKSIMKYFSIIIDKYFQEKIKDKKLKIGESLLESNARYKLGSRCVISALKDALNVYIIRQANLEKGPKKTTKNQYKNTESQKYKKSWAEVAMEAKIDVKLSNKDGSERDILDINKQLTTLAKRHYDKALVYIQKANSKVFP